MTHRTRLLLFTVVAGALLASPTAAFAQTRLIGTVGENDAFTIALTTTAGARVTDLPAGAYEIEVRDRSEHHNFHLMGPGINMATDVGFIGTVTWNVTLRDAARYTYVCDPHAGQMRGTFTTGGGPPTPPPPPPPPAGVQTLTATVGPSATISLRTANGRRVTSLRRGRYRIRVRDRSRMHNFHLIGPRVNRKTTVRFRGTVTWTLTLRRGTHRFVCDPHARRMKGSFRVT
jgi:plastocyanin